MSQEIEGRRDLPGPASSRSGIRCFVEVLPRQGVGCDHVRRARGFPLMRLRRRELGDNLVKCNRRGRKIRPRQAEPQSCEKIAMKPPPPPWQLLPPLRLRATSQLRDHQGNPAFLQKTAVPQIVGFCVGRSYNPRLRQVSIEVLDRLKPFRLPI